MTKDKTAAPAMEQISVRFPKDVLDVLRQSAHDNDRSLNAEIVNAARSRVKAYQAQKGEYAHARSE